jgi:ElaB/YqjD/DUF883 family membrane-anchored ribosome-binding protein
MTTELAASQGSVQGSRDKLVNDFKRVVGDADVLLKEVVSSSADQLTAARSRIASKACSAMGATQDYVRDNPIKIVGVAALAGLLAAYFLSARALK